MTRFAPLVILLSALVLAVFTVVGKHGLLHLKKINNELATLEEKNRKIKSDIVDVQLKISALKNSPFALEKKAREELGLSRPSEIVYILSEAKKQQRGSVQPSASNTELGAKADAPARAALR